MAWVAVMRPVLFCLQDEMITKAYRYPLMHVKIHTGGVTFRRPQSI